MKNTFKDTHNDGSEYNDQSRDFLATTGANIVFRELEASERKKEVERMEERGWNNARYESGIFYRVRITRGGRSMSFVFHDSIHNATTGARPTDYDVLACLTKNDPYDFDTFISDYGIEIDSYSGFKKARALYNAVKREYNGVMRLFSDVIDALQEIQ